MDEGADALILNPAYWREHSAQLVRLLATPSAVARRIADPSGQTADRDSIMAVHDPAYWVRISSNSTAPYAAVSGRTKRPAPSAESVLHLLLRND